MSRGASTARGQGGFTLTELLIVVAITGLVMAAVLGIYMQGSQSFLIGSARVETQENARTVLDTIARELRTATAVTAVPSATNMTFTDQDGVVVQYQLSGTTLNRIAGGVTTPLASGVVSFALTYYSAFDGATNTGTTTTLPTAVHVVRVQLSAGTSLAVAAGSPGDQRATVETTVRLRNLSEAVHMRHGSLFRHASDQRGVALPMALMAMVLLGVMISAFLTLSSSEPTIANNQMRWSQARAVAESGVERAIWALSYPADAAGIPATFTTAPAPYDGSTTTPVTVGASGTGRFRLTVTNGAAANERNVTSVGYVPSDTASNRAVQTITVTLVKFRWLDPPAALSVRGELEVSGNSTVDSRSDTSCGTKHGTFTTGDTSIGSGAAEVYGADGNSVKNQTTGSPADIAEFVPTTTFDNYIFSSADLVALKAYAKSQGTYYQGSVTFNSGSRMPNGLIFVDTVSGDPITSSTASGDFGSLSIHGNAPADPSGIFSGWIVVNGNLSISGNFQMKGMIYAVNDFSYTGTGTGRIEGAVLSQNIRDTSSTTIDTTTSGNSEIIYNCAYAKTGNGLIPQTYTVKGGTFKEVASY